MAAAPDFAGVIEPSPHSLEGTKKLYERVAGSVGVVAGQPVAPSHLQPEVHKRPLQVEEVADVEESAVGEEPVEAQSLAETREKVSPAAKFYSKFLEKLNRKGVVRESANSVWK